jgi:hypothetical protein
VPIRDCYIISVSSGIIEQLNKSHADVYLREMSELGMGCVVVTEGVLVKPSMHMFISDSDSTNCFTESLSSQFMARTTDNIVTPRRHEFTLLYETMKPDRHFNKQSLLCVASADGYKPVTARATIIVMCK